MKRTDKIFLVGLPGSGKSTFGKALSQKLQVQFIDLDAEIIENEHRSIPEIFKTEGEEGFRKIEQENLQEVISKRDRFLLATGGGTPCFFDNMEFMKSSGFVIFLNPNIEEIVSRVITEKSTRPLIEKIDNESMGLSLNDLYKKRLPYYKKAHLVLDHDDISVDVVMEKL